MTETIESANGDRPDIYAVAADHAPRRWRGFRSFLKEYAIIVVGVLTALAAEQIAQRIEWAHKVRAAEQAMLRELLWDDGPQVYQRAAMHDCVQQKLDAVRAGVEASLGRGDMIKLIDGVQYDFLSYDTLAHEAATNATVADHMSPAKLDTWTKAYSMLPYMERTNAQEAESLAALRALRRTGAAALSEDEQARVLAAVEALKVEDLQMWKAARWTLPAIRQLGPLDDGRMSLFRGNARRWYGDCVKDLPADWPGA